MWTKSQQKNWILTNVNVFYLVFCMSCIFNLGCNSPAHDDVIKWKHFPGYWPFVQGIHQSPVNSPYKGQWRRALMFSLICTWINGWVNKRESGDLRCHHAHYDVSVMPWVEQEFYLVLNKKKTNCSITLFFSHLFHFIPLHSITTHKNPQ